jgi:hypothetical protein
VDINDTGSQGHPNKGPSGRRSSFGPVVLPAPPRGVRKITTRSRFSARGYLVAHLPARPAQPQRIGYESQLERSFVLLTLAQPDVVDLIEQPFTVVYKDDLGRARRYTIDYVVVMVNGHRAAVEVKTSERARSVRVLEKLAAVASQMPSELANEVRIFTDAEFEPWMVVNAAQLLQCRHKLDPAADAALESVIAGLNGQISISDLVTLAGIGAQGYPAIIRALYSKRLRPVMPGLHGPKTLVVREERS